MPTSHDGKAANEGCNIPALKLSPQDDTASGLNAVDLEHSLRKIKTNRGNLHGGRLVPLWRHPATTTSGTRCRSAGAVHPINYKLWGSRQLQ
jgi:hypothetical protein